MEMGKDGVKRVTSGVIRKGGPGTYYDRDGLRLVIGANGRGSWIVRYSPGGGRPQRDCGLGPARGLGAVTLDEARAKAAEIRRSLREGIDPIDARKAARAAHSQSAQAKTFEQAA